MDQRLPETAVTDWRGLCEELISLVERCPVTSDTDWIAERNELIVRVHGARRVALAQPEPEVVGPSDEELLELMPETMRDEFSYAAKTCSDVTGGQAKPGIFRVCLNTAALEYARAVLARWGHQPAPPAAGEVGELVAELEVAAVTVESEGGYHEAAAVRRAADLLEQRHPAPVPVPPYREVADLVVWLEDHSAECLELDRPEWSKFIAKAAKFLHLYLKAAPVPVASDTRYEFSVYDGDCIEQAGGSAPTYAQTLSEGQHYLAQYQQDGPHTLEVRRVENLNPGAFPAPDDAPVPVLPEDAQAIEPIERTILVPAPVPVAVSERPWEREGWCDDEDRCWCMSSLDGPPPRWWLVRPEPLSDGWVLPATALPLPSGEVEHG